MILTITKCPNCRASDWRDYATYWHCVACDHRYPCIDGIPCLYLEERIGSGDLALRDYFYNGLLGRYYQQIMPFLALPVRPGYWKGWLSYWSIIAILLGLIIYTGVQIAALIADGTASWMVVPAALLLLVAFAFFAKHRYLLYLLMLAVPVKLSLRSTRFRAKETFAEIHGRLVADLKAKGGQLAILDISTGTCNSLYRHGWMELDAQYVGLDLSETMLLQGRALMAERKVPMDFVLGDAMQLPFCDASFDAVLNYGALNGYSDAKQALAEMARVTKPGGTVVVLDEQLYEEASAIERVYFKRVLASHDVLDRCPVDLLPPALAGGKVHQVYHFYYLFAGTKQ